MLKIPIALAEPGIATSTLGPDQVGRLPLTGMRRVVGVQAYETGRRCTGKRYDELAARRTPLDLRTTEHRVSDLGDDLLVAQVRQGEHDLGGINSLA